MKRTYIETEKYEMVSRLMQEMNLRSIRSDAKKNYMRFSYEKKMDSLKMNFYVTAPNIVWVSDVTYFKLGQEFYYVCTIIDLYSRKVIAYKVSRKHSTQLISGTFRMAYAERHPGEGLTFHSDRVAVYISFISSIIKELPC